MRLASYKLAFQSLTLRHSPKHGKIIRLEENSGSLQVHSTLLVSYTSRLSGALDNSATYNQILLILFWNHIQTYCSVVQPLSSISVICALSLCECASSQKCSIECKPVKFIHTKVSHPRLYGPCFVHWHTFMSEEVGAIS